MSRSYGTFAGAVERRLSAFAHILVLTAALTAAAAFWERAQRTGPITSRSRWWCWAIRCPRGLAFPAADAFPAKLQKALKDKGITVEMTNAGVSGDTASGGRDRLDWSVPEGTRAVIVELGANDALRGTDPAVTRAALVRHFDAAEGA